jgi:hypothetical protein
MTTFVMIERTIGHPGTPVRACPELVLTGQ